MKIKIAISFVILVSIIILYIYGSNSISKAGPNVIPSYFNSLIPIKIKTLLKKTIFIIPDLKKTIKIQEKIIYTLKSHLINNFEKISLLNSKKIKTKFNTYNIEIYPLYFPNTDNWKLKPVAYLDQTKKNIIIVSGNGVFFSIDKYNMQSKKIKLKKIHTNINDIIKNELFYLPSRFSIRDLLIYNNLVFVSYVKEVTSNCYNTSVLKADLDLTFLRFSEFFSPKECLFMKNDLGHGGGGRITPFQDNNILLSVGEFGMKDYMHLAQEKNSIFGKIISIDLQTGDYELRSMGHRNPQGLYYDKNKDIIISTEHGPQGGDEVNINLNPNSNVIENYGWPISSYGLHYDGKFYEDAPLHKSHKDYGFIEPIKDFTPGIAISEIIKIPISFNEDFINDVFVASMGQVIKEGDLSIHHFRFNENYDQIIFEEIITIGERIRDMLFFEEKNQILLILESIPALAVLKIVN